MTAKLKPMDPERLRRASLTDAQGWMREALAVIRRLEGIPDGVPRAQLYMIGAQLEVIAACLRNGELDIKPMDVQALCNALAKTREALAALDVQGGRSSLQAYLDGLRPGEPTPAPIPLRAAEAEEETDKSGSAPETPDIPPDVALARSREVAIWGECGAPLPIEPYDRRANRAGREPHPAALVHAVIADALRGVPYKVLQETHGLAQSTIADWKRRYISQRKPLPGLVTPEEAAQ